MILTCPECATSFKVADDAIGANGRTVRCSQCSTTWFVAAEPDVLNLEESKKVSETRDQVSREAVSSDMGSDFKSVDFGYDDALDNMRERDLEASAAGIGAHAAIRDNADRIRARRRLFGVGMIWVVTLSILALFALSALLFRATIVEKFPGTAPIYKAIGLEANASGLEIYNIETRYGNNEGVQVLFVSGKIKNYDRKTRDVDLIKLSFKNEAGEVLTSWVVEPPQTTLKSGKTIEFASQYPNPPIDAVKLAPGFVTEAGVQTEQPTASQ
ncbi:MAG: zinc-ribbon domain-containing protein [Robiginitomaculum sp.]|nr:zinc-ribbon domain-containing protein [Robiginitomaculum sp.]